MTGLWVECGEAWAEFSAAGRAVPGVQFETAGGVRYLVGDVNTVGGVCDDCPAVKGRTVIARYRVLVELTPDGEVR